MLGAYDRPCCIDPRRAFRSCFLRLTAVSRVCLVEGTALTPAIDPERMDVSWHPAASASRASGLRDRRVPLSGGTPLGAGGLRRRKVRTNEESAIAARD